MYYLSKVYRTILQAGRKIFKKNYLPEKKHFLHKNVPYFAQWESKELVEDIISCKISAKDDPLWQNSGAKTRQEYELWSWNGCGMACLKMILAYQLGKEIPLVKLGKRCQEFGGYIPKGNELEGLYYRPFISFIKKDFGLDGKVVPLMEIDDIVAELAKENFIIASVSDEIRDLLSKPSRQGGHLVLVLGYDFLQKRLSFHNPSGVLADSQKYVQVSFADFEKFFAHKGISIGKSQ